MPSHDEPFRTMTQHSRGKKGRFDDDETCSTSGATARQLGDRRRHARRGHRWSTWDQSTPTETGPRPHPDWLVTELAAVDTELGILKTGKEADVFLIERGVPGTDRRCLLAAKRYRAAEHRMFHRDAGYLEGRRVTRVPDQPGDGLAERRSARRSSPGSGRRPSSARCAGCTSSACPCRTRCRSSAPRCCWSSSATRTETAAPRLAQLRPDTADLADLWRQLVDGAAR